MPTDFTLERVHARSAPLGPIRPRRDMHRRTWRRNVLTRFDVWHMHPRAPADVPSTLCRADYFHSERENESITMILRQPQPSASSLACCQSLLGENERGYDGKDVETEWNNDYLFWENW